MINTEIENNNPLGKVVSRAACIRNINNKKVTRTIGGMRTIEDIPEFRKQIEDYIKTCGNSGDVLVEEAGSFHYGSRLWMKPKMHRVTEGVIKFRSKDFHFEDNGRKVYGSLTDVNEQVTKWHEFGFVRVFKHPFGDQSYVYLLTSKG